MSYNLNLLYRYRILLKEIVRKSRDITLFDFISFISFLLALPASLIFKRKHQDLWLICEDQNEARDNGYWFFKYVCENHPEQDIVYAINKTSVDYKKVVKLGKVIQYGSLKHWVYYLAANYNISSQKGGKPNAAVCYVLEVLTGLLKNKRIFLGHGITINDAKWLYYEKTKFSMFLCGSIKEKEYVEEIFGYPKGTVQYFGLPRMDNLHKLKVNKKQILIMPSWRAWLVNPSENDDGIVPDFVETEYYKKWQEFINNEELNELLKRNNLNAVFYPHRNCQKYIQYFSSSSNNIIIAEAEKYDIQQLLKESALMITDYSSVFMDFIYMKKPVIFYQFDKEEFFARQYQKGYFNYDDNRFTESFRDLKTTINCIKQNILNDFVINGNFRIAHNEYFKLFDCQNSKRLYLFLSEG